MAETTKPKAKLTAASGIKASKANVVQQAKLMDSAGTAWFAVKHGNLEMITRLFPSQCNVYSKGPVGDNCFHIALLLNTPSTLAIAKYLVKLYGKTLVNTPYQERTHELDTPGHYEGETGLHIAIVNRDFDMVKFLIQAGADVRARCYGAFFQPGSVVYYGEYPLSFAACTGQKDIVSYLKRHGARVNHDRDTYGNTALHLCVCHDQLDMYDHLVEYCGALEHVRNNRGMTPLLLAASLGKLEFFQHIYNKRRRVAWAYGPVTSYSLSLHEIDSVQNSRSFVPSAVETIVRKGHMHMIDDPLVKTLLTSKWHLFARAQFVLQGAVFLVLVILQTFLVWLHCSPSRFNSYSREALEICCLILAAGFFALEVVDVAGWTIGVSRRRQLMKANAKYCPPLYPIPGETQEAPVKAKSGLGFLGRLLGRKGEPVAEGVQVQVVQEGGQQVLAAPGSFVPWHPDVDGDAAEASISEEQEQVQGPGCAGPVAEGKDRPSVQFQQVDDVGVAERSHSIGAPSITSPPATKPAYTKSMSMQPSSKYSAAQLALNTPVDIVSVGLSSPAMMPQLLPQPSFFMQPQAANTMLNRQDAPAPMAMGAGQGGFPSGQAAGNESGIGKSRLGSPSAGQVVGAPGDKERVSGIARDSSEITLGTGGQEIRNRIRGGGGGDLPTNGGQAIRRAEVKKPGGVPDKEDALPTDDDREPLHVGGFVGAVGTLAHSLAGYYVRQAADPITVLALAHQLLTFIHFITWVSAYGGIDGDGPSDTRVQEFDDIIVSLMALSGWTCMMYYTRGAKWCGQFAVVIEMCVMEVVKFCGLYFFFNIGYTLAFYAVLNGTTQVVPGAGGAVHAGNNFPVPHPFSSIGTGMMQLLRFMYGEAEYETYSATEYRSKKAVATCYFILYIGTVLLLLVNLLIALLVHSYGATHSKAEKVWLLRWASYVIRAEARLPRLLQQKYRLGEVAYDPALQERVYNHVFEVVDDDHAGDKGGPGGGDHARDKEVKALEALLQRLRKGQQGNKSS
uniref:Ion transport domain-containing protein n=1 Tax=Chlamydomonas leiostraca TaxID=1034604 RepID=A0A7S0RFC8_9CHLO|mmetsp:Transcript_2128/g.5397  ORF Transcript_2128/g.5397 Transcript_2128/m.5397 type:complete len:1015 (+) Transcript_2128:163-3207(+)|eukprot:CAMPEP_0202874310 /NCGR_PEP_ID=MMETSP1391-20130828/25161_1 /ASSEMBLY_ACC=CAM_ASM_000867 /TAXON_ID=1034604 /ORGANISM="Chlamydomonas leiostraca, Strain SAG 11-49" /LENGTH=1014 /DNA_ID=CAMNT_0049555721 /DNA_START=78 /DNA_END=3122 /DNA_ORIENTATION=+